MNSYRQSWSLGWLGILIICLWAGGLSSCTSSEGGDCDKLDLSKIDVNVTIEDLTPALLALESPAQAKALLKKNPLFAQRFAQVSRMPEDTVASVLVKFAQVPHMDTLYGYVKEVFGDYSQLKQDLTNAFKHVKYYYPSFKVPKVKVAMTGVGSFFGRDLYVSEEVIFLSLDYFIGNNKKYKNYRPRQPGYILKRYAPEYIVPSIMQFISVPYNKVNPKDRSLVAEMVTYGKTWQFVKTMIPCAPDSLVTGYTARQLANVTDLDNKKVIWGHFLNKQVLFVTTPYKKKAYTGERPYTAEIGVGKECPGRIGWWVGWQIIRKYMKKFPKKTFQEIMADTDNRQIFNNASYKGE
ncbi:MAG TPA: gliding motility lipoprotein GldB [Microscillaceae bacterium]|nr:gliding motility lipoprotein GldB [Microscillaceae bacterium]